MFITINIVAAVYFATAIIVFDMSRPAFPYDEEYRAGRLVCLGPCPRRLFVDDFHGWEHFDGDEWPFIAYAPLCMAWRLINGFERPTHSVM